MFNNNFKGKGKGLYAATHRFFACESYGTTIAQMNSWRKVKTDEQSGTIQHSKQSIFEMKNNMFQNY